MPKIAYRQEVVNRQILAFEKAADFRALALLHFPECVDLRLLLSLLVSRYDLWFRVPCRAGDGGRPSVLDATAWNLEGRRSSGWVC